MLTKLFGPPRTSKSTCSCRSQLKQAPVPPPEDPHTSPLKIVHAGGFVECYYMAVPAVEIMEKYPRSILAHPDVFRRPWDSLVVPEQILTPGETFYVVPRGTIRKLRRRIRRPSPRESHPVDDSMRQASGKSETDFSNKSCTSILEFSVAGSQSKITSNSCHRTGQAERNITTTSSAPVHTTRKRRVRAAVMWQPSLTAIDEKSPLMAPPPPRFS